MDDIGTLTNLKELRLLNTRITDDALARLSTLTQLETLDIGNFAPHGAQPDEMDRYTAPFTDKGMESLARIENLRAVNLNHCRETDAGVAEFRRKRPSVELTSAGGSTRFPAGYSLP